MSNIEPVHILRYGTVGEKAQLEKAISSYDYLAINGNTAAYVSNAIAKFIVERFFSKESKGFFIDPITYAFQDNIDLLKSDTNKTGKKDWKKSIQKLIAIYGAPVTKVLSNSPICPSDFNTEVLKSFCEKVLSFQYDLVYNHVKENNLQKYIEYAQDASAKIPSLRPKFLIAPYFYIDNDDGSWIEWLEINKTLIDYAAEISKTKFNNTEIFAQIVISKNALRNRECIQKITSCYANANCNGYTVWVDGFSEHEANKEELQAFVNFLRSLKPKPIYNMYGGYFSILLTHEKISLLNGVSHGLEYGESRQVYPVGGGLPVSKYYYLPLHQRMDFTKAFYLLEHAHIIDPDKEDLGSTRTYYKKICGCKQCRSIMGSKMINFVKFESTDFYEVLRKDGTTLRRKKATTETKQNCLFHYLMCKMKEFSDVKKKSIVDLLNELQKSWDEYYDCNNLQNVSLDYMQNWSSAVKEYLEENNG